MRGWPIHATGSRGVGVGSRAFGHGFAMGVYPAIWVHPFLFYFSKYGLVVAVMVDVQVCTSLLLCSQWLGYTNYKGM